jgi:guanylate kinase
MSTGTEIAPLVLIVSGPSGSGKSTLVQRILELPGTMPSISCTTRSRRATEASGKCYDFVTEAEFEAMVARGEFLEYARVFGMHSYGTPKKWLEESRKSGLDLVLEIDVQGASQVKEKLPESVRFLFCHRRARSWSIGCAAAGRIRTKRLRGGSPRRVTKLRSSASITIFAW